jgi:hypothetical protein
VRAGEKDSRGERKEEPWELGRKFWWKQWKMMDTGEKDG